MNERTRQNVIKTLLAEPTLTVLTADGLKPDSVSSSELVGDLEAALSHLRAAMKELRKHEDSSNWHRATLIEERLESMLNEERCQSPTAKLTHPRPDASDVR